MKKIIISITILILMSVSIKGQWQEIPTPNTSINISKESIFIHYNSTLLFSGERLFYKLYCLDNESKQLSNLSKIAYIELIGEKGNKVFKQKIKLENGQGSGDFLISGNIPSDNYKLIGYTHWMQNNVENKFFQGDLSVLNPYQLKQRKFLKAKDSITVSKPKVSTVATFRDMKINLSESSFGQRKKVSFSLVNTSRFEGEFSISIRKKTAFNIFPGITSQNFTDKFLNTNSTKTIKTNQDIYLPELRGEIFSGTLESRDSNVSEKQIALSIPGKNGVIKIISTDKNGDFKFNIGNRYDNDFIYMEVIENKKHNYTFKENNTIPIDLKALKFREFHVYESDKEKVLERSIYNQIENAYQFLKTDSIITQISNFPFHEQYDNVFTLADFNRFSSMEETFVEIIYEARISKDKKGNSVFVILDENLTFNTTYPPLLIFDGLIIQDPNIIINYNANNINTIKIIRDKYYIGTGVYNGVIVFESYKGDYFKKLPSFIINKAKLFKPEDLKEYHKTTYDEENLNARIPDYRKQLYWNPSIKAIEKIKEISFFTSDNKGTYEIKVEGFLKNGKPISIVSEFSVK
ncbi:MAG: hypothetical protein V3U92_16760 [Cellulophaga sp.]